MSPTKLSIDYISPLILLLFLFIISSLFWIAVPHARAGGASLCTNEFCQDSEEMCLNTDQCCVGGGFECPACFWTGTQCINALTPPTPIPTLNQWGKIVTMAVIGLFAVIGIFAMRRGNVLKPY